MSNSKVFSLVLGMASMIGSAAPAWSAGLSTMTCDQGRADAGLVVRVRMNEESGTARVYENTVAGQRLLGSFAVTFTQDPTRMGAPEVYSGQDFELQVQTTVLAQPDGWRGVLNADVGGRKISEDVFCR